MRRAAGAVDGRHRCGRREVLRREENLRLVAQRDVDHVGLGDERVENPLGIAFEQRDRVVTKGAVQVRLASAANAIPAHNHNH